MPACRITSNEEYENARRTAVRGSYFAGWFYITYCVTDCILATCLPFYVPIEEVPYLLQRVWHPMGLLVVFFLPLFPLGMLQRHLWPNWRSNDHAILTFEQSKRDFTKWEKRKKPKYLVRSHQGILAAYDVLQDVPHYQGWRQKVVSAFGENRRTIVNL